MKFLLLAAALASVHAEANPAFTYATGYHLPYAIGAPLAYTTHAVAPVVYTAAAGCQNDAGAVVPLLTVVSLELSPPPLLPLPSPLLRRRGRRGRPPLRLRPRPGCSTGPTATGPSATVTLPTATLPTPTLATTATTASATTTATTAGRRGRRPPRLTLRLPL